MTQAEALDWVARLFDEPLGRLSPDTPRAEIAAWDSLGVLTLLAGLDKDFGITMEDDALQDLKKVNDILQILRQHKVIS